MLVEIILFTILSIIIFKIIMYQIKKYYISQEKSCLLQKVLSNRKIKNKLEYYFPSNFPSNLNEQELGERVRVLDWFLSQSKTSLMVKTSDNILETWNINDKYQEFINTFYTNYGIYPTLNQEFLIEDDLINLEWDDYQISIEWSLLAIMIWITETGILDYFDNNYEFIEIKFNEFQSQVKMIDGETICEDE